MAKIGRKLKLKNGQLKKFFDFIIKFKLILKCHIFSEPMDLSEKSTKNKNREEAEFAEKYAWIRHYGGDLDNGLEMDKNNNNHRHNSAYDGKILVAIF
jgi:hypothetical protein